MLENIWRITIYVKMTKLKCSKTDKKMLGKLNDKEIFALWKMPSKYKNEKAKRCKKEIDKEFFGRNINLKPVMDIQK